MTHSMSYMSESVNMSDECGDIAKTKFSPNVGVKKWFKIKLFSVLVMK